MVELSSSFCLVLSKTGAGPHQHNNQEQSIASSDCTAARYWACEMPLRHVGAVLPSVAAVISHCSPF